MPLNYWDQVHRDFWESRPDLSTPLWRAIDDQAVEASSVVEVGCGVGRFATGLPDDCRYTGIDASRQAITMARQLQRDASRTFLNADFLTVDPSLVWADVAIAGHIVEHLPEAGPAMEWLFRAAGSRVIVSVSIPFGETERIVRTRHGYYKNRYTLAGFERLATAAGWEIRETRRLSNGVHGMSELLAFVPRRARAAVEVVDPAAAAAVEGGAV